MRKIILPFLALILGQSLLAQEGEALRIVDQKPVLQRCLELADDMSREQCSNEGLLTFIYKNVVYPDSALALKLEGMVVAEIEITKQGRLANPKIIKDIGGGCGDAVLRVLSSMTEAQRPWTPAIHDGMPVDYLMNIPIKFSIPEPAPPPLPYKVYGKDTIYFEYSEIPLLEGDFANLEQLLVQDLKFPKKYADSCIGGSMVAQVVITKEGLYKLLEVFDYEGLGLDFQFELMSLLNTTSGKWSSAKFKGRPVNVVYNIRAQFIPKSMGCTDYAEDFLAANEYARQGEFLYEENKIDEALVEWGKAIELFPNNAEFRLMRGQTLFDLQKDLGTACEDLTIAGEHVALASLYATALPLICQRVLPKGEEESAAESPEKND